MPLTCHHENTIPEFTVCHKSVLPDFMFIETPIMLTIRNTIACVVCKLNTP